MQFDSQERNPIFYVVLVGLLIFAIVFFAKNVKKAINSGKTETTTQASQSVTDNNVRS